MDDAIRLPGLGPVIGGQVCYQLTLMLRTPRTLMAGLILPGALLGLQLTAGAVGGLLLAGSLGALALAAAGTAITPLLTSAQGANPLLTLTYLPLTIFSGGFGGLSGLPHWLNTLMSYLPAQPMIDAVNRALQHSPGLPARDLAVLAAWALGGLLLSVRFFRWD